MTKEDKELLLQDLCARLQFGLQIHIDFTEVGHIVGDATLESIKSVTGTLFDFVDFKQDFKNGEYAPIHGFSGVRKLHFGEFKPYLRPMSNMTEKEKVEIRDLYHQNTQELFKDPPKIRGYRFYDISVVDWLNQHHFDYRGLISKGLALEAPSDMYK